MLLPKQGQGFFRKYVHICIRSFFLTSVRREVYTVTIFYMILKDGDGDSTQFRKVAESWGFGGSQYEYGIVEDHS